MSASLFRELVRDAADRYPARDRFARHFASGKLNGDPIYLHLLESGQLADEPRILDIGCGQGTLAALLAAARDRHASGDWPAAWPAPPSPRSYHGIDMMAADIARATAALGADAHFTCADMRDTPFGPADTVVILDVLHYVSFAAQDDVLRRVRAALSGGGTLLMRVAAKSNSLRFRYTEWVDRLVMRLRGYPFERLYSRPLDEWIRALESAGFRVESRPMSQGTWFANVLLVGCLPVAARAPA